MSKKQLKALEAIRKSLKKEVSRLKKHEERGRDSKAPHPIIRGYLEGMRSRRHAAQATLVRIEESISEIENGAAKEPGKPNADRSKSGDASH